MPGTLHLVCGKIGAGKSTLCARLGAAPNTVTISEDGWLKSLFGEEMREPADYVRVQAKFLGPMGGLIADLLRAGLDVVLDFQASTVRRRAWMKSVADAAGAPNVLHFLDVPEEICRARLHARNASGDHEFVVSDEEFDLITSYFVPQNESEGLTIVRDEGPPPAG